MLDDCSRNALTSSLSLLVQAIAKYGPFSGLMRRSTKPIICLTTVRRFTANVSQVHVERSQSDTSQLLLWGRQFRLILSLARKIDRANAALGKSFP